MTQNADDGFYRSGLAHDAEPSSPPAQPDSRHPANDRLRPTAAIDENRVVEIVRNQFGLSKGTEVEVKLFVRSVWKVTVAARELEQSYFVKTAGKEAETQFRLLKRADEVLGASCIHVPSQVRYVPECDVVISKASSGRGLGSIMADGGRPNPIAWFRNLYAAMHTAGAWLKMYHDERHIGSISQPLMRYLENRKEGLDRLEPDMRRKLLALIGNDLVGELVVTHGDYNPSNVLWDGKAVSVIDFGMEEWSEMSPYWDVATFLNGVDRRSLFHLKSPLYWLQPLPRALKRSFSNGYGNEDARSVTSRARYACEAVRHFSFVYGSDRKDFGGNKAMAHWGRHEMERILFNSSLAPMNRLAQ